MLFIHLSVCDAFSPCAVWLHNHRIAPRNICPRHPWVLNVACQQERGKLGVRV